MLLAVDIGNSQVTLGVFAEDDLLGTFRLQSRREQTADEYAIALAQLFELSGWRRAELRGAIAASVVPQLTSVLGAAVERAFGCVTRVVTPALDLGLTLGVDRPSEVGVDRLVNVAAAREWLRQRAEAPGALPGAIVVDLGTATTFDVVSPSGEFLGGVIVAGMRTSFDSLIARTARLPEVELVAPARVLGKNTADCLRSGSVYGYASLVDGMVARLRAELAFDCRVLATGGLAEVVAPHASCIEAVERDLTLRGLLWIERRCRRGG